MDNLVNHQERKQVIDLLLSMGVPPLPVAPLQDAYKHPVVLKKDLDKELWPRCHVKEDLQPIPAFTGKNPSFLDQQGVPCLVAHKNYQTELPKEWELRNWFANSSTGIGTLGKGGYIWIDIDSKHFDTQPECDQAFENLLAAHPELNKTWLEQTHSGGYRIGVKVKHKPGFTNFALSPGGKHIGEALGEGRFTVLSPTIGPSGRPYRNINRAIPLEVDSLESIGIFSAKPPKIIQQTTPHIGGVPGIISLEALATEQVRAILNGENPAGDRSGSLTKAIKEWYGWENWCHEHGVNIATSKDAVALAHEAASNLGIDAGRAERILKSINSAECQPAAALKGGDESCWKKIYKLDKSVFSNACPPNLKEAIISSWRKPTECKPSQSFSELPKGIDWCVVDTTVEALIYERIFESGKGKWRTINDSFYEYTGRYWQKISDQDVLQLIGEALKLAYKTNKDGEQKFVFFTESKKKSAFQICRDTLALNAKTQSAPHLRAFKNCTVDLRSGETMPHDPKHYLTSIIDSDYVPVQECPKIFRDFIASAYGADLLENIRAFTYWLLDPSAPYGKFIHLIGPSGSGKGTLLRFWGEMFGLEHYRSGDFSNLATAEERHQYLTNAALFAVPDTGGFIRGLKAFYELVDNGPMTGRALFSSHGYEKIWQSRFVIASVDHLTIENSGDGWERRCLMLPTIARQAAIEDPMLGAKLAAVKSQVLSWALSMDRTERDRLILHPSTNERILGLKNDAAVYGDPVRAFVDMCLRPAPENSSVESHQLHTWFEVFCGAMGYAKRGFSSFISHLKTVVPFYFVPRRRASAKEDPQRRMIAPHWLLAPLPFVFMNPDDGNPEGVAHTQWICKKSACQEGGLSQFQEIAQKNNFRPTLSDPSVLSDPFFSNNGISRKTADLTHDLHSQIRLEVSEPSDLFNQVSEKVSDPSQTTPNRSFPKNGSETLEVSDPLKTTLNQGLQKNGSDGTDGSDTFSDHTRTNQVSGGAANSPPSAQATTDWSRPEILADIADTLKQSDLETIKLLQEIWPVGLANAAASFLSPTRLAELRAAGIVTPLIPGTRVKVGNHSGVLVSPTPSRNKWWIRWDAISNIFKKAFGLPPSGAIDAALINFSV